ncbi:hypothetical protein BaRGS_00003841 [Batillaria attramentaria]|uniref:Uncharacterized protein n=1 Tax=Batillaria attramentaria TaxID=370345 RepID=A0ABD0M0K8_9CAEN
MPQSEPALHAVSEADRKKLKRQFIYAGQDTKRVASERVDDDAPRRTLPAKGRKRHLQRQNGIWERWPARAVQGDWRGRCGSVALPVGSRDPCWTGIRSASLIVSAHTKRRPAVFSKVIIKTAQWLFVTPSAGIGESVDECNFFSPGVGEEQGEPLEGVLPRLSEKLKALSLLHWRLRRFSTLATHCKTP